MNFGRTLFDEKAAPWLAHGLIVAMYLSVPLGTKVLVFFATVGSIVGWILMASRLTQKVESKESVDSKKFFILWFSIGLIYLLLHAVQLSSPGEIRRLDAPARVFLLSGLIVLPSIANRKFEEYIIPLAASGIIFGAISSS